MAQVQSDGQARLWQAKTSDHKGGLEQMAPFKDEARWLELAQARGMRLPKREVAATPGNLERWLRRIGVTPRQWAGITTFKEWREMNPGWPMRAVVGLLLEWLEARRWA